ncbi:MAG TPA: hypothetical protein VJV77_14385 [Casimicrobiaceae bacterium]|nr:hypothetical protein [Casimicrobiaceae bacterium]
MTEQAVSLRTLSPADATLMRSVLSMFGRAFHDVPTYVDAQPGDGYLERLLGMETFIALAAVEDDHLCGTASAHKEGLRQPWQRNDRERAREARSPWVHLTFACEAGRTGNSGLRQAELRQLDYPAHRASGQRAIDR